MNTFMARPGAALAPRIRPDGPDWSQNFYSHEPDTKPFCTGDNVNNNNMPQLLKGQKALVRGANSGIGKAVAIVWGGAGAYVVVNYVHGEDSAKQVACTIARMGVQAIPIQADVSSEEQVTAMFRQMFDAFGT